MSLNATPRGAPLLLSPETPSIPQARLLAAQLPFWQGRVPISVGADGSSSKLEVSLNMFDPMMVPRWLPGGAGMRKRAHYEATIAQQGL